MQRPDSQPTARQPLATGVVDRLARRLVLNKLAGIRGGEITLRDRHGVVRVGEPDGLNARIDVRDIRFYRQVAVGGGLAAAASYLQGDWECDDLTTLFRILADDRNESVTAGVNAWIAGVRQLGDRLYHRWRSNSRAGARRNIHAHYDLGNDFFGLWLDDTWAYSCGVFPHAQATLREASLEKFDRVCHKLDLQPRDHLLEIGSGWGGLAIHAASHFGCRVTTTTISKQQFDLAKERIVEAGVADRVTILPKDYRDLTVPNNSCKYDKLVSIEMIEAVGHEYFDAYFGKCAELLKPDGTCVLQAIVMPEAQYAKYLKSVDFIQRYVFPGGCLPSVGAMLASAGRTTKFRLAHVEDFGAHYAETLRHWRRAFEEQIAEVRRLGYSEELIRLWRYYLSYCEAAFEDRHVGCVQMQFDQLGRRRDPALSVASTAEVHSLDAAPSSVAHSCRRPLNSCRT